MNASKMQIISIYSRVKFHLPFLVYVHFINNNIVQELKSPLDIPPAEQALSKPFLV